MNANTDLLVPHPGDFIREELEARGWSQRDLAFVLGKEESGINAVIGGRRGISPEMAKLLGDAFDVNPELFMNLQRAYDLSRAPNADPGVARRAKFQNRYPVRDMVNRGWIAGTDPESLEMQLALYFRVGDASQIPHLRHSAKKTHYEDSSPAQVAWLFRARQIAETMHPSQPYSEPKLRDALPRLHALMTAPEEVRHVPRILDECGVRFIVIEALPGSKIAGVCFWPNKASPVIALSVQRDQIDSFWFDLRHEIQHVLERHGQTHECIDSELGVTEANVSAEEAIANREAEEFCVPRDELSDFMARVNPYFGEQRISLFAQRLQIHPGIVVGQLQKRLDRWDLLKKLQPKVRQYLILTAVTDGWGTIYPVEL